MQDEFLISEIEKNLAFLASRGMPTIATSVEMLIKRFKNLKEAHHLLAQREERLTQELVELRPMKKLDAAQESYGVEGLRPCEAPALIECPRCGGSGFSSPGTGYGDVCAECGGLREIPRKSAFLHDEAHKP